MKNWRQWQRRLSIIGRRLQQRQFRWLALSMICLILIFIHAFEDKLDVKIDEITIWLLVIAVVPGLVDLVETIRAGEWEVRFRSLDVYDQLLEILKEVGRQRLWTFYESRENEHNLGHAFAILVRHLLERGRPRLVNQLKDWLETDDDHLRWLAAEIAGYFMIGELRNDLLEAYKGNIDNDSEWPRWRLNCLWAHSRFSGYAELRELLLTTSNELNQVWLLFVYRQMTDPQHHNAATPPQLVPHINDFLRRADLSGPIRTEAQAILAELAPTKMTPSAAT